MIVLSASIIISDGTKVYFANVTNDVMHRHFDSLDVTKHERISQDNFALVVALVSCLFTS